MLAAVLATVVVSVVDPLPAADLAPAAELALAAAYLHPVQSSGV